MPHLSDAAPRPPEDFAALLAAPDPLLIIGGQAVNLWALYFEDLTRDLAPFVSRDADVLGDRDTLVLLGRLAGKKPQFFPLRPPSNEIGVVIATDGNGSPLLIEVLRYVRGASNEELSDPAYEFAIGENLVRVRVPGPIALLQAKVANLAEIQQTGRQDARHILILARILPAYLASLCESAGAKRMEERKVIDLLERLLAVVISRHGRKAWAQLQIAPKDFFRSLPHADLPKVRVFLENRLPRVTDER
ncbi:MAG: hypothetical protein C0518_04750 [Opitutus sp.]|nr:hypothetical protein [Opitutus sp.]